MLPNPPQVTLTQDVTETSTDRTPTSAQGPSAERGHTTRRTAAHQDTHRLQQHLDIK